MFSVQAGNNDRDESLFANSIDKANTHFFEIVSRWISDTVGDDSEMLRSVRTLFLIVCVLNSQSRHGWDYSTAETPVLLPS
jgi:hypothetical protein